MRPTEAASSEPKTAARPMRGAASATVVTAVERALRAGGRLFLFGCCARVYSLEEAGTFAYLLFAGTLLGMLFDLGLSGYLERELPSRSFDSPSLVLGALRTRLIGVPCSVAAAWLVLVAWGGNLAGSSLGTIALANALTVGDFLGAMHRGHGRYDLALRDGGAPVLLAAGAGLVASIIGCSFAWFQVAVGTAATLPAVVLLAVRLARCPRVEHPTPTRTLLSRSKWFLAGAVISWARFEFGVALLKHLSDDRATALFAAALRPVGLLSQGMLVVAMVFTPSLSHRNSNRNAPEFVASVHRWDTLVLCLLAPGYALCMLVGKHLLMAFGTEYLAAEAILSMLALAIVLNTAIATTQPLIAIRKEAVVVAISALSLGANLGLGLLLVPSRGALGAAWAFVLATLLSKTAYILAYRRLGLPLGNRLTLAIGCLVALWFIATLASSGLVQLLLMLLGLVLGSACSVVLLARTRLF